MNDIESAISQFEHLKEKHYSHNALPSSGSIEAAIQALCEKRQRDLNPGEVSDGYHTFNELYHHRAILFSVVCAEHKDMAWKSKRHHDGTMYDGMFIVGIDTPEGQATYHYDIDPYWDVFDVLELDCAPEWDGHTPGDAIARIEGLRIAREHPELLTLEQL